MANEAPDRDELRLLYEVTVSDLTYFKTQQWSVANYCMLSYAALVGVATLLRADLRLSERIALVTLSQLRFGHWRSPFSRTLCCGDTS